ncbi:unnamed protein product [Withania somnifera]
MAEKSKVLIIGGTGSIGKFVVEASAKSGHLTFALVRETTVSDPVKGKLVENFMNLGVTIINRFFPSEFGMDVDKLNAVEPAISMVDVKVQIRRATEAEGIPYTYPGATAPPRDKVIIPEDGNVKAVFNEEHDIGTYTIKAVDDPRTLNKTLYIKPPKNTLSFNELVATWEKLIGKTLEKIYVPEEQILKDIQTSPVPINVILALNHSAFVKGDQTNFKIEPSFGVEASELYPDVKYTTVEEYLSHLV